MCEVIAAAFRSSCRLLLHSGGNPGTVVNRRSRDRAHHTDLCGYRRGAAIGTRRSALYWMHGPAGGVLDVTGGTTSTPAMAGCPARPGYDPVAGIGTTGDAWRFASALARLVQESR